MPYPVPTEVFVPYMPNGTATPASIVDTLNGAALRLGADGSGWVKGQLRQWRSPGVFAYCLCGALEAAAPDYQSYDAARRELAATVDGSLDRWNDRPERTIADVQLALAETAARLEP
jgi:hypothetical protein